MPPRTLRRCLPKIQGMGLGIDVGSAAGYDVRKGWVKTNDVGGCVSNPTDYGHRAQRLKKKARLAFIPDGLRADQVAPIKAAGRLLKREAGHAGVGYHVDVAF